MSPVDGLVIALHGPWGSGKTTILNFVEQYLKQESETTRPVIVKFAPWWFSGQHDLTERFFDQLSGNLKEEDLVSPATLQRIADFTDAISELPIDIPILSKLLRSGGKILRAVREARQKNLTKLKERLESSLRALGRKIVIIIDDIDRLTAEEIRQIFSVVKAVANFPNTIYLLAFDRDVAVRALEPLQDVPKGKEYLEKIVQVSWEIPPPEDYMLPLILLQHVNLAAEGTADDLLDQHDFTSMFAHLRNLLRTPRECARIGNALITTYPSVRGEVNFTDFVALEVLRVCMPELHRLIRTQPEQFAGIVRSSVSEESKKSLSEFHDRWLNDTNVVPQDLRTAIRDVLTRVFPKLQIIWGVRGFGADFLEKWRGECRAASPEILPTYFRLAVPSRSFSQRTMAIIQTSSDFDALRNELSNLLREKLPDGRTAISVFIERVTNLAEQIKLEGGDRINLIAAILNDRFIEVADSTAIVGFPIDNSWRIIQLCRALLRPVDAELRANYLKAALDKAPGLSAVVDLVSVLERQHEANGTAEPLVSASRRKELIEIAENRISQAAENGLLPRAPQLAAILGAWKRWNLDRAKKWVTQFVRNDEGLLILLEASTAEGRRTSIEDKVSTSFLTINVRGLLEWIDLSAIRSRLEFLMSRGDISERQRFAADEIVKFLDSDEAGRSNGLPSVPSVSKPEDPDR